MWYKRFKRPVQVRTLSALWIPNHATLLRNKTERNFCFKCQHFTETVEYLIKLEISFCQDCPVLMKIKSDEPESLRPICHQVKENNNYFPQKAPTTKTHYLQKRYNALIWGFTLDQIERKQVQTMFNALVEFIESQKKLYLWNG